MVANVECIPQMLVPVFLCKQQQYNAKAARDLIYKYLKFHVVQ
jgi:hypothetical protein